MPTVSICIPSYNHAAYLPAAIESALGQTYRDLEVVIVDDGSTDESLEIARAYERREPERVRVFTHAGHVNRGISETANLAREHARGSVWSGLPSDDVLHAGRVERLMAKLRRNPELDVVYSYARYVDQAGRPLPEYGLFGVDITREPHPVDLLIPGNLIAGMTILARQERFDAIGFHEEGIVYSDWELWLRVFASLRVGFVPAVLVDYRIHEANTSVGAATAAHIARQLEVIETVDRKLVLIPGFRRTRFRALLALEHAYLRFCTGELDAAKDQLSTAFEREPALSESPAPLAYFIARWEADVLHPHLTASAYTRLAARLRRAAANPTAIGLPEPVPGNFGLWLLSSRPPSEAGRSAGEWLRLVAAVQHIAAAKAHRHAGEPVRAAAQMVEALRTYPRLLAGRTPRSLFSRSLQPAAVRAIRAIHDRPGDQA